MTRSTRNRPDAPVLPEPILAGRAIAIARGLDPALVPDIGRALIAGGIRAFEVTLNSEGALEVIGALRRRFAPEELLVGAGTVLDLPELDAAIDAGAQFIVTPVIDLAVIDRAVARGVPVLPGAFSPTDVLAAWRAGAAAVKLFPASVLGPAFVRELRGPLPDIPVVPTGGISADNAAAFIAAGAAAIGIGSWLTGSADPGRIEARARELSSAIADGLARRPAQPAAPSAQPVTPQA